MADVYEKQYTRDFSLAICQVWQIAETEYAKNILPKVFLPHIFEFHPHWVCVWVSKKGYQDLKNSVLTALSQDPDFISKVSDIYTRECKGVEPYLKENKIRSSREFEGFLAKFIKAWSYLTIIFEVPKYEEIADNDREYALQARQKTEYIFEQSDNIFRKYAVDIFPQYEQYSKFFTLDELKKKKVEEDELLQRSKGFVYQNDIFYNLTLADIAKQKGILFEQLDIDEGIKEFSGKVAMSTDMILRGKVKLILTRNDFQKFNQGDILVTFMTNPEMVPLMKKAKAIITDEGGITSHAAIVARELKKPCIIGTKIATQVLKDGDLVEVDAIRGVIKIIKNN